MGNSFYPANNEWAREQIERRRGNLVVGIVDRLIDENDNLRARVAELENCIGRLEYAVDHVVRNVTRADECPLLRWDDPQNECPTCMLDDDMCWGMTGLQEDMPELCPLRKEEANG